MEVLEIALYGIQFGEYKERSYRQLRQQPAPPVVTGRPGNEARRRTGNGFMTSAVAKPRTAIAPYPGCAECLTRAFGFCDLAGGARPLNGPVPPAQQMRMVAA